MSQWITYVKKYAAANGLTYKQALVEASKTYKNQVKKAGCLDCKKKKIACKNRNDSDTESEDKSEESEDEINEIDEYNERYASKIGKKSIPKKKGNNKDYEYSSEDTDSDDYTNEDNDNSY